MPAALIAWLNKTFKFLSMLITGHHPAGFLMLVYLLEIDSPLVAPTPFWSHRYKSQQRVGAGVFIPATKTAIYVNSGGVGISDTINRAELAGIASALRAKVYPHSHG